MRRSLGRTPAFVGAAPSPIAAVTLSGKPACWQGVPERAGRVAGSPSRAGQAPTPLPSDMTFAQPANPSPTPQVTCKEEHSPLLSPAPGQWCWPTAAPGSCLWVTVLEESAVKPGWGQPEQGNPSASPKKGQRQQKKEASQACLIALLLL